MGDEQATGILGHLPPWPRQALNNSVIAMEQAYRQRKSLPLLTEEDMAALRAGEPMAWERGDGADTAAAAPASTPTAPSPGTQPHAEAPVQTAVAVSTAPATATLSDEVQAQVASGKKWSKSAIAAEQARRNRKGLPALNDAEIAALLGEAVPAPAAPSAAAPVSLPSAPVARAPSAPISDEVKQLVAQGKKWSKSSIAAEQARRNRKGLLQLNEAEVAALLGEPEAPASPAPVPAAAKPAVAAAAAATPARVAVPVPPSARTGEAVRYVGTPAVGTSKAAAAGGLASVGPQNTEVDQRRRQIAWSCIAAFLVAWLVAFFRFFLPRTLFEPSTVFKIGSPSDFALGIDEKYLQKYRIWVDRTPERLFVIYARCTHLGCTPDWKPAENKFKCPCHGSGYDSEGVNFEGPAPRPMDRAHVELAPDGQVLVDTSRLYSWPKGQPSQFNDPGAFLTS